jgi:hypothetical protein
MRQRLKSFGSVPPGKFCFTCPETGYRIDNECSLSGLLMRVEDHYKNNDIPLPDDWRERVENQICEKLPAGWCNYEDGSEGRGLPQGMQGVTAELVWKGVQSLAAMLGNASMGESNFVSTEEAERRANICTRCHYNHPVNACKGCHLMRQIVNTVGSIKGERVTSKDSLLMNCGICGCRNDAIVHVKTSVLQKGESPEMMSRRPAWCWITNENLQEAENKLRL